jgi:DUF1680 family protein
MISFPAKEKVGRELRDTTVRLVPYYAWNNRGEKSMIVWFPQKP